MNRRAPSNTDKHPGADSLAQGPLTLAVATVAFVGIVVIGILPPILIADAVNGQPAESRRSVALVLCALWLGGLAIGTVVGRPYLRRQNPNSSGPPLSSLVWGGIVLAMVLRWVVPTLFGISSLTLLFTPACGLALPIFLMRVPYMVRRMNAGRGNELP